MLHKLSFYDKLSIEKISKAFESYARSYRIEIKDSKDPSVQLIASKSSIKDLFKNLLYEIKGFKYHITVKVLLRKHKDNRDIEFAPVYFNSTTKTVINSKYDLDKSFQEILYSIDNWINEGSGWVTESTNGEYINISFYSPLSGSSYIKLPHKLINLMKGLIHVENNDDKFFIWCHIRHLNLLKTHPERITKQTKIWLMILIIKVLNFLFLEKIIVRLKKNNKICINVFCYENNLVYPVHISDQKFKDCMNLL